IGVKVTRIVGTRFCKKKSGHGKPVGSHQTTNDGRMQPFALRPAFRSRNAGQARADPTTKPLASPAYPPTCLRVTFRPSWRLGRKSTQNRRLSPSRLGARKRLSYIRIVEWFVA